jgi:signal transduction histidine kinase
VTLLTPEGRQVVNTGRPLGEELPIVIDHDSFQRAVATRMPTIGNLRRGQVSGQMGFPVRVPVVRNGRVPFVVSAWITSTSFATVLTSEASIAEEWVHGVADADGMVVARSRDADRFVGQKAASDLLARYQTADQGMYRGVALDGTRVYSAFVRAPLSRWIAGVAVPASVVDASFRQSMVALAAVTVLLVAVGGGGTYLMSRRIARDISKAADEAELLAGGRAPAHMPARVTEIQRLLDALARSAALLEMRQRERDEQVAAADAARATAEAADRAKDEFLAMLGHELRNPLAPALTAIQLMKARGVAADTRERDVLERQIQHMARLVDDLLDVSRLRRGAIELRRERFEVSEAISRAVEMTAPIVDDKRHALDVDVAPGLALFADRIRIAQVLSNLLTNAAKYTEPGGRIALTAREENGFVVIECRDNGIGMTDDLVPRVFDLFVQGQRGLDRRQGGLGLGLAVARTLVELHGGTIEAASGGTNHGSTFTVRLPIATAAAADAIRERDVLLPPVRRMAKGADGLVMVVDDNRDARDTLIDALKQAGLDAVGAASSAEALDLAARRHPRVAVLDIGLPEIDGYDLARALRSRSDGVPRLIALTGYGRAQDMEAARQAGFDAYFVKPVDISVLLEALDSSCN